MQVFADVFTILGVGGGERGGLAVECEGFFGQLGLTQADRRPGRW